MKKARRVKAIALSVMGLVAVVLLVASATSARSSSAVTLRYALWDNTQQPGYQKCANAFHAANPNITISIEQKSWNDYWTNLTTEFAAGTAPDVFTDHLAYVSQFASQKLIVPLDSLPGEKSMPTKIYAGKTAQLWVLPDGHRYAFPKDTDTGAVVANPKLLRRGGVTLKQLWNANWNPTTGGTFQKIIARLTRDTHGRRGDQKGFDPKHVKIYGFAFDSGTSLVTGQDTWGMWARSMGIKILNKNPWGNHYNYDNPKLARILSWFQKMVKLGYSPAPSATLSHFQRLEAGQASTIIDGNWRVTELVGAKGLNPVFAPVPAGPDGHHWSLGNSLGDSIWAGTKHRAQAWKWVQFLASRACQNIMGKSGAIVPAIVSSDKYVGAAFRRIGASSSVKAYGTYGKYKDILPLSDHFDQVSTIIEAAMTQIINDGAPAAPKLKAANKRVNALFG
jgi:multiple sugar transport system substrate-binding protein